MTERSFRVDVEVPEAVKHNRALEGFCLEMTSRPVQIG